MDIPPINKSLISESNVVETSNVETKSFATETKTIILKNAAVPSKDSHDKNKSNKNQNSENKTGNPNLTNEVSSIITDEKKPGVLDDSEMLQKDSNTSQENDIQMDIVPLNESSISEPNIEVSSNVEVKSFQTKKKFTLKNHLYLPQIPKIMIFKWTVHL